LKQRFYPVAGIDLIPVAEALALDLEREGYLVRRGRAATPQGPALQIEVRRPHSVLQETTGQGAALRVLVLAEAGGFRVQITTERWGDKAAGAVEWLLATPMLVTEGYAAFQRAQLDERVFRNVEAYLAATMPPYQGHTVQGHAVQGHAAPPNRAPAPVPTAGPCASCRAPMPLGGRFCPRCGHDAQAPLALGCRGCGHPLAPDAAFCPSCGAKVAGDACPRCATPLDAGAAFCSGCGAKAAPAARPDAANAEAEAAARAATPAAAEGAHERGDERPS
jgi:double zinc ribbon protein